VSDYVYPSIYFSYFLFAVLAGLAIYFFVRTFKHGYWGRDSEAPKLRMLEDADSQPCSRPSDDRGQR